MAAPYRIAIDGRALASFRNGSAVYLGAVIRPLLAAGWEVTLLTNRALDPGHDFVARCQIATFGSGNVFRWEQRALPRFLDTRPAGQQFDLYFGGSSRGIPWRRVRPHTILSLLDTIPFQFPRLYLWGYPWHFLRHDLIAQLIAIRRANAIITISRASAADIEHRFKRAATPLLIPLQPVAPPPKTAPHNQFVYVGGVDPRKRIDNLLRGFAQFTATHPDFKLILIGRGYEVFQPLIGRLGISDQVVLAGYIEDDAKLTFIQQSRALVYPSLYEGYGLAIAEGFQAGVPVIAGRGGAQAEVGGGAVRYIDPTAPADIAAAMTEMLDDAAAARWREAGRQQLARLTDPSVAAALVAYFTTAAERARKEAA
jgi:glycosyltransferase involved in cell wall biosynthesis